MGASWEYLGPSGKRLGLVLEASWSRLEGVLGRLGPSWGVMWVVLGASWRYLVPDFQSKGVLI